MTLPSGEVVAFDTGCGLDTVAYLTLSPLLGTAAASLSFAVALLASGQSSTITGTLGRAGGDGGIHGLEDPPLAAAIDHPLAGHRAGDLAHWLPRGQQCERSIKSQPGGPRHPVARWPCFHSSALPVPGSSWDPIAMGASSPSLAGLPACSSPVLTFMVCRGRSMTQWLCSHLAENPLRHVPKNT